MLLHLLGAVEDRAWLVELLGAPERDAAGVARVRALMDEHGSLEYARRYATGLAAAAGEALDEAFATCPTPRTRTSSAGSCRTCSPGLRKHRGTRHMTSSRAIRWRGWRIART